MAKVEGRENFGEDPKFFIGKEVEKTPLHGRKTLFVIGRQNPKEILARCLNNKIDRIWVVLIRFNLVMIRTVGVTGTLL